MSPRADEQTVVRLRASVTVRGGARFNTGETVGFDEATAKRLIAVGLAEAVPQPQPAEEEATMPASKAFDHPPNDKMVHGAPVKKGGRP